MTKVFISYSHRDKPFVQQLFDALNVQGFDVWMDSAKLIGSADWWERICKGIEESTTVIFVSSQNSLMSEVCTMEVHQALKLNKRLIPIILENTDEKKAFDELNMADLPPHILPGLDGEGLDDVARKNWRYISRYHWIIVDDENLSDVFLSRLVEALKFNAEYVDKHSDFLNRAINWDYRKRHSGLLLSRIETKDMQRWFDGSHNKEPPPHELHQAYLNACVLWHRRQRVRSIASFSTAITATLLIVAALVFTLREQLLNPPPRQLTGAIGVAIAEFTEDIEGIPVLSENADRVSDIVERSFANFISEENLIGTVDYIHQGLPAVTGDDTETRERSAISVANLVSADVVIYGHITHDNKLQLRVYVDPLFGGGDELYGESRFGAAIDLAVRTINTSIDELIVENAITPRVNALTQFLYGIALTRAELVDPAIVALQNAADVPLAWQGEDSGLELVYLWIGTAYNTEPFVERPCPYPNDGRGDTPYSLFCARASYEEALNINETFPRAYIGLGNVHLNIASPDLRVAAPFCNGFENAIAEYESALALNPSSDYSRMTLLEVKTYANIGQANTRAMFFGYCSGDWYRAAVQAFDHALEAMPQSDNLILIDWELVNIYYWLGRTHRGAGNPDEAIPYYELVIEAIDSDTWPQHWQEIRYWAYLELGHAFQDKTKYGDGDFSEDTLHYYQLIIDASEDEAILFNDKAVISEAVYNYGIVIENRNGCTDALPYYATVTAIDPEEANPESYAGAANGCSVNG